jgi:hypothetical protein
MSIVRALGAGKEPTIPARQEAMTSSGPDTRNMGAHTTGNRKVARNSVKRLRASVSFPGKASPLLAKVGWVQ